MFKLFPKTPAAAFDRLLDRIDPHNQDISAEMRQAQRLCGRWLARQRLLRGLTTELVAERTGVDMQTLFLLEAGLANEAQEKLARWSPLAALLADEASNADQVRAVLSIAVGHLPEQIDQTLARVRAELAADVQAPVEEDSLAAQIQTKPTPKQTLAPLGAELAADTLYEQCSALVDSLMARYGWRLLDRAEFARAVAERVAAGEFANPNPAALALYCRELYSACFGHEGAELQEIGFSELHSYLYQLSFRVVADLPAEERENLVSETVARIWQRLASYRKPSAFLAVAAMELRNVLRPHWKRADIQYSLDEVADQLLASERHGPLVSSLDNELRRQVQACFIEAYAQHPRAKKQIDAVRLTYLGYDDAAISAQLGTPVKNVYVLRSRGLDLLSKQASWQQLAIDSGLTMRPLSASEGKALTILNEIDKQLIGNDDDHQSIVTLLPEYVMIHVLGREPSYIWDGFKQYLADYPHYRDEADALTALMTESYAGLLPKTPVPKAPDLSFLKTVKPPAMLHRFR